MDYSGVCKKVLEDAGIGVGDTVSLERGGRTFVGVVMPRHMFTGGDILVLKLSSGYNIGIRVDASAVAELVQEAPPRSSRPVPPVSKELPPVSFLGTGGTIASFVDYRTGAVHPAVEAQDILASVPELSSVCGVGARVVASILSEDVDPGLWVRLAGEIVREFSSGARGVVVPHGTDTMGYTSAALSFLLRDLPGPVVLVGSQRSSDRPSSDASMNLLAAARTALTNMGDVVVVMHHDLSDGFCDIHRGTRVRKLHTSRRDAFRSVNSGVLGRVGEEVVFNYAPRPVSGGKPRVVGGFDPDVVFLQAYPGMTSGWFRKMTVGARGVLISGTGLGHVPSCIIPDIRRFVDNGGLVAVSSQCLWGRTNLNVYSSGRELLDAGVVECGDMLVETALVKLMWALGTVDNVEDARNLMMENIAGELSPCLDLEVEE